MFYVVLFFFSSRRRHTRCALVTGVQTCALPIFQRVVAKQVPLSPGVSIAYSGQFEYLQHAIAKLKLVVPATLLIIFVLLYMTFGRFDDAALIMGTLPFALTGGIWFLYLLGFNQSVATGVGFIALAGVSAEFGVVMLIYLKHALAELGPDPDTAQVEAAVRDGALLRVRPKALPAPVLFAGLLPTLPGRGTGSAVMTPIAAPTIGRLPPPPPPVPPRSKPQCGMGRSCAFVPRR